MPAYILMFSEVLTGLFLFVVGACIGSFLNVVIYRVPNKTTLLGGSRCATCSVPIAFRDNIPVLGWWLLGGRCRACHQQIAHRYWIVESMIGAIFLCVGLLEIAMAGINLPVGNASYFGFTFNLMAARLELVTWALAHILLLVSLLVFAWIDHDGHPTPWSMALPLPSLLAVWRIAWPQLIPGSEMIPSDIALGCLQVFFAATVGSLAGHAVGCCLPRSNRRFWAVAGAMIAVAMGLPAFSVILLLSAPFAIRFGAFAIVWATIVQLLAWRWLDAFAYAPLRSYSIAFWPAALAVFVLLLQRTIGRKPP